MISSARILLLPSRSLVMELKTFVPYTIVVAFLASAVTHWSIGGEGMIAKQGEHVGVVVDGRERKAESLTVVTAGEKRQFAGDRKI